MALHRIITYALLPLDLTTSEIKWIFLPLVLSFDLFPSLVLSQIVITSLCVSRSVFFDKKFDVATFVLMSLLEALAICCVQGFVNKIGFMFIETELLREGND